MKEKIRKAKKEDLKRVTEIFSKEYAIPPYKENWTHERAYEKILDFFKRGEIFVKLLDKKIIGFIVVHEIIWDWGDQGFIDEVAVSHDYQGKGYGKSLFQYVEKYFKKKGVKKIALMSNTRSEAYKKYKKWDYRGVDYIWMEKELR
jgi:aminoglycoside 6'-N-acetyltransferase I